jgi:hypothetical protein
MPSAGLTNATDPPEIYIWVRATVEWSDEAAFHAQLDPGFKPRVELWNQTFSLPFHLFRHRVREIASANLSRTQLPVVTSWAEIPRGALVVPVDDDDWLAPNLAAALEAESAPGVTGYRWPASFVEVPTHAGHRAYLIRRRVLPWWPEKWFCSSNNYALVKDPGAEPLLASHVKASEWFERRIKSGDASAKRIESRVSLINRTLASQTTLHKWAPALSRSQLLRKFRRYRKLYRRLLGSELAWAAPYVAMMAELMEELEVK